MKYLLLISFTALSFLHIQAQSKWSLQTAVGVATETNLGDTGLRLSSKVERSFGKRLNAFAQVGTFQMFRSNENWEGEDAFREERSLSTANLDLGLGYSLIDGQRFRLDLQAAGSYRAGRQLWPETAVTINGHRDIYYTLEKIRELGYVFGLYCGVKASERCWIGLDAHCHSYNYLGEYLGIGLGASIQL